MKNMRHTKEETKEELAMKTNKWKYLACASLAGIMVLLSGCGKTEFAQQFQLASVHGAGSYQLPAKVDILLVTDDSGSMISAYNAVKQQMPSLLNNLDKQGWDYHFATIPLTVPRTITQIMASKYDPNWGSFWVPPYPGALTANVSGAVSASSFRTPLNYTDFLTIPTTSANAQELGFLNITNALTNAQNLATNFLRSDAELVVVVVGNGNDGSGVTYCNIAPGLSAPCELYGYPGTAASSFQNYMNALKSLKPSGTGLIRFYSAVANADHTGNSCNLYGSGTNTKAGSRYIQMTQALSSDSNIDICGGGDPIGSLVTHIGSTLTATRLTMRTKVLVIPDHQPLANASEQITVTKTSNGVSSTIPQDSFNGWSFIGNGLTQQTAYSIEADTPDGTIQLNQVTDYHLIQLNGSAVLQGNDTAVIQFKTAP